jgi:CheY-like chemotaxis protein
MGDQLKVDSVPGKGSRFFFTLPLVAANVPAAAAGDAEMADAPPLDARLAPEYEVTALVADDSTVNRRILAALLESAGVRVIAAAGGVEAVDLARQHRPDIVFMDVKMADLDGLAATRRLQADPDTAAIPVIAVTASAFGDTRAAARAAGCVDYLSKPVRAESLFAALQTHLGVRFAAGSSAPLPLDVNLASGKRRLEVAARLLDAVTIGDVTQLEGLAQELVAGDAAEAALGHRMARLVTQFDFDGLRELAGTLTVAEGTGRAVD